MIETGAANIYIDPYKLHLLPKEELEYLEQHKADYIVITHTHGDHLSPNDIALVKSSKTTIIAPPCCKSLKEWQQLSVGQKVTFDGIEFEAVAAYNTNKPFHTKEMGFIGVIITINGKRLYHAGDTDVIEEMSTYKNLDLAMIPVSGTYVMTADEAIVAAGKIEAKTFIPMHWGVDVGDKAMAEHFVANVKGAIMPSF